MPLLAATLLAPRLAIAAACHDEADRLAGRHALDNPGAPDKTGDVREKRAEAQQLLDAARKADDDGIVEECLRQLAQARALIETAPPTPGTPSR